MAPNKRLEPKKVEDIEEGNNEDDEISSPVTAAVGLILSSSSNSSSSRSTEAPRGTRRLDTNTDEDENHAELIKNNVSMIVAEIVGVTDYSPQTDAVIEKDQPRGDDQDKATDKSATSNDVTKAAPPEKGLAGGKDQRIPQELQEEIAVPTPPTLLPPPLRSESRPGAYYWHRRSNPPSIRSSLNTRTVDENYDDEDESLSYINMHDNCIVAGTSTVALPLQQSSTTSFLSDFVVVNDSELVSATPVQPDDEDPAVSRAVTNGANVTTASVHPSDNNSDPAEDADDSHGTTIPDSSVVVVAQAEGSDESTTAAKRRWRCGVCIGALVFFCLAVLAIGVSLSLSYHGSNSLQSSTAEQVGNADVSKGLDAINELPQALHYAVVWGFDTDCSAHMDPTMEIFCGSGSQVENDSAKVHLLDVQGAECEVAQNGSPIIKCKTSSVEATAIFTCLGYSDDLVATAYLSSASANLCYQKENQANGQSVSSSNPSGTSTYGGEAFSYTSIAAFNCREDGASAATSWELETEHVKCLQGSKMPKIPDFTNTNTDDGQHLRGGGGGHDEGQGGQGKGYQYQYGKPTDSDSSHSHSTNTTTEGEGTEGKGHQYRYGKPTNSSHSSTDTNSSHHSTSHTTSHSTLPTDSNLFHSHSTIPTDSNHTSSYSTLPTDSDSNMTQKLCVDRSSCQATQACGNTTNEGACEVKSSCHVTLDALATTSLAPFFDTDGRLTLLPKRSASSPTGCMSPLQDSSVVSTFGQLVAESFLVKNY